MKKTLLISFLFTLIATNSFGVILFSESHVGIDFDDLEFDFQIHDVRKQDKKLLTLNSKKNKGNSFELSNLEGVSNQDAMLKECELLKKEFVKFDASNGEGYCEIIGNTKKGKRSLRVVMNKEKGKAYLLDGSSDNKKSLKSEFDVLVSDLQTF